MFFDEKKIAKCSIEQAYYDGKVKWKKPMSCHLYPVRITKTKTYEAVNYDQRDVCKPACKFGKELSVEVFRFLKEPLVRKYGEDWYKQMEGAADYLNDHKENG